MESSDRFAEFLADGETVVTRATGTLIDGAHRREGSIGITDRRILFLSTGDRFFDVAHDAIYGMRSRPRAAYTAAGIGHRLLMWLGATIATGAFLGGFVLDSSALALLLTSVAVVSAVGAEYVRRFDDPFGRAHGEDVLVLGLVTLALTALIALIVLTGSPLVVPLVLLALGGLVVVDLARRRKRALDRNGESRRHERQVTVHLADGRTVRLRVDVADRIDHVLSSVARETDRKPAVPSGPDEPVRGDASVRST